MPQINYINYTVKNEKERKNNPKANRRNVMIKEKQEQ